MCQHKSVRHPYRQSGTACMPRTMPPAKRCSPRRKTNFRALTHRPSWLHLSRVQGGAVTGGGWAGARGPPFQVGAALGGVEKWARAIRGAAAHTHAEAQVETFQPVPLACQPAPHSAHGIQGRNSPSRLVFLPFLSHHTHPKGVVGLLHDLPSCDTRDGSTSSPSGADLLSAIPFYRAFRPLRFSPLFLEPVFPSQSLAVLSPSDLESGLSP